MIKSMNVQHRNIRMKACYIRLDISPSKIAINFCYSIYKLYTKPASLLPIAIDLTRSLRHRFRKPSFSPVHTYTRNRRFRKSPLWRAFSKTSVFGRRKRRLRVDATAKRREKPPFSKISGYVWTGPE